MVDRLNYENKVFWQSLAAAFIVHLGVIVAAVWVGTARTAETLKPLAVIDFAIFDPEAGLGGVSDTDEIMEPTMLPALAEVLPTPQEADPDPEPEPVDPISLIESTAEKATEVPMPTPPLEEIKKPDKPKPKAKPKEKPRPAQDYRAGAPDAAGDVLTAGGMAGLGTGGVGSGRGRGNPDLLRAYTAQIQRKLNRYKKYPPEAKSQALAGQVVVNFSVNRQGQVISSRLVRGSGYQALDQEVMALLKRISPLPPIPSGLNRNTLNLSVPVYFSVR
jgi:protein TonB